MQFDDRLDTVMQSQVRSDAGRRTQYRQLLDILGHRRAMDIDEDKQGAAYRLLAELTQTIPASQRAAILEEGHVRLASPRLAETLATQERDVAMPAIRETRLADREWIDLIPALPQDLRESLKGRDDLGRPVRELLARIGVDDAPLDPDPIDKPDDDAIDLEQYVIASEAPSDAAPSRAPEIEPPPFISRAALGLTDEPEPDETPAPAEAEPEPEPEQTSDPEREAVENEAPNPIGTSDNDTAAAAEPAFEPPLAPTPSDEPDREPEPATGNSDRVRSIGELVRRIEHFRKARDAGDKSTGAPPSAPRLPLDERQTDEKRITAIDFATDRSGRIAGADPAVAPMVVGFALSRGGARIARAIARRLPIVDLPLDMPGAPAIAGRWQVDAMPVFEPDGGRFLHYRGRLRRPGKVETHATRRAEKLRQLLHELRTPVNAVQGFAEAIQQQVFGDVPHSYRAYAATIASDSAAMMAGFEELERFARLTGGDMPLTGAGCDLSHTINDTLNQLATYTQPRVSGFKARLADPPVPIAMSQIEGERLVWRMMGTLAGETAPGEYLALRLTIQGDMAQVSLGLPRRLGEKDGDKVFEGGVANGQTAISAGMFGSGFALRLARAEARAAGGELQRDGDELLLSLPMLTGAGADNSDDGVDAADAASTGEDMDEDVATRTGSGNAG